MYDNYSMKYGGGSSRNLYMYLYICVFIYIYIYICIFKYLYTYVYIYMYICMYVYICIYVCTYIGSSSSSRHVSGSSSDVEIIGGTDSDRDRITSPCFEKLRGKIAYCSGDDQIDEYVDSQREKKVVIGHEDFSEQDSELKVHDIFSDEFNQQRNRNGPLDVHGNVRVTNKEMKPREKTKEHIISMYFEGRWLDLSLREALEEKEDDPLSSLDIQVLFERLLKPLLGIECPRTDHRLIYGIFNTYFEFYLS
jgi:hypothetical protein